MRPQRITRVWPYAMASGLLAMAISLVDSGRPGLWYDEAASVSAVSRSWSSLVEITHSVDLVHLAYYSLLKLWTGLFGTAPVAVRSLSALLLGGCCALTVVVAADLFDVATARWTAAWVLLLPGLTWCGFEARSSALSCFAVALATVVLTLAIRRASRWPVYALTLACCVVVQVLTVLVIVPHAVIALRRQQFRRWAVTSAATLLITLPFLIAARAQAGQIGWLRVAPGEALASVGWSTFFFGLRPATLPFTTIAAATLLGLVAWTLALVGRRDRLIAWTWAFVPALAAVCYSLAIAPVYQERYFSWTVPAFAMLVATGCSRLRPPFAMALTATALVASVGVGVGAHTSNAKYGQDYRPLAGWLGELPPGSDVVFASPPSRAVVVLHPQLNLQLHDVSQLRTPAASGTLWGVDRPPADAVRSSTSPTLVVLYERRQSPSLTAIERAVAERGCVRIESFVALRTSALRFGCPTPAKGG